LFATLRIYNWVETDRETDGGEDDTGTERGRWTNLEDIGEGREDLGVIRDRGGLRRSNAMSRELINNSKSTRTAF
jgi:hypothetical protein